MAKPLPHIPDELVYLILQRLPVKPILRFKCVSKTWNSMTSEPEFVRSQLKFNIDEPQELILTSSSPDYAPYILTLAGAGAGANDGVSRQVPLDSELKLGQPVVEGSCDGLILLVLHESGYRKLIFNPITLATAQVPDDRNLDLKSCVYGFGHDSLNDDYKIVSLCYEDCIDESFVDVYSLKLKCWRRIKNCTYAIEKSPYSPYQDPAPGVFLNGCLHWCGKDSRTDYATYELVCFNLATEEFVDGLLPHSIQGSAFNIRILKGSLALVCDCVYTEDDGVEMISIDVWVMREYGNLDSWTKSTTICPEDEGDLFEASYNAVCDLNEDEIVVEKNWEKLFAYNQENGVSRDLVIAGLPHGYQEVMPFRGSLVSPN